ncbi:MAG: 30S ribosomal protein S6 [bacterium]|nr:30S ribosomal protein S6 [bacterium]
MADVDVKTYEVAYLINPDIPEDGVFGEAGKITGAIQDAHGLVGKIEEPKRRKLAYPIEKFRNAYFGWTTFSVAPERLIDIEKRVAAEPAIIRHLIVEEVKRPVRVFRPRLPRRDGGPRPPQDMSEVKAFTPAAPKEEDKTKIEELDKQLEEILGK